LSRGTVDENRIFKSALEGSEVEGQRQAQGIAAVGLHSMAQARGKEEKQPGLWCDAGRERTIPEDEVSRPLRSAEVVDP